MERMFVMNLRSREIEAQVHGRKRPLYEGHLLDRDIHISEFEIPEESTWAGKPLSQLRIGNRFGVHVSSIMRGSRRINIPGGDNVLFPGDKIQVIGNDEQLAKLGYAINTEQHADDPDIEKREMHLQQIVLTASSPFIGKTIAQSGIREHYGCMVVGIEAGQKNLTMVSPTRLLRKGDIIWIVGEEQSIEKLTNDN